MTVACGHCLGWGEGPWAIAPMGTDIQPSCSPSTADAMGRADQLYDVVSRRWEPRILNSTKSASYFSPATPPVCEGGLGEMHFAWGRGRSEAEACEERKQTERVAGFIFTSDSAPDDTACWLVWGMATRIKNQDVSPRKLWQYLYTLLCWFFSSL